MAEAIANEIGKGGWQAFSAGAAPYGAINPLTIETLKAHGHETDELYSKPLSKFLDENFDVVITVCDNARQSCPVWPAKKTADRPSRPTAGKPHKTHVEHWDIEDPSEFSGSESERRAFFELIYADIKGRIEKLLER